MYSDENIKQARNLYVFKCMPINAIAEDLDLPYRTLSRWKTDAKNNGDCWKTARTNALVASGGDGNLDLLLNEFITFFNATMEQVKYDQNLSALEKVNAISSLGDAYAKVIKSAGKTNPHKSSLAIALDVMKKFVDYLESTDNTSAIEQLVPELKNFGEYYKKTVGKR